MKRTLSADTPESLQGESGFSWLPFSRGEVHLYNLRHIQHHTGAMSAYVRRVGVGREDTLDLRWVKTGWR